MGVMEITAVCAVAAIVAAVVCLLMKPGRQERVDAADLAGRVGSLRRGVDDSQARLTRLEERVKRLSETPEAGKDREKDRKPVDIDSIRTALRSNGFSPEIAGTHSDDRNVVNFEVNGVRLRMDASKLPFLLLELGFQMEPGKEDVELMRRAASDVTSGIIIGKAIVLGDGQAVVFQAEILCDSYVHLRDNLKEYLQIVDETKMRFFDTYERLRAEKAKAAQELLSKPLRALEDDKGGTKILS